MMDENEYIELIGRLRAQLGSDSSLCREVEQALSAHRRGLYEVWANAKSGSVKGCEQIAGVFLGKQGYGRLGDMGF